MWDLGPRLGIEPAPPALEGEVLTTGHQGSLFVNFSFLMRGFHRREWMIILDDHTIKALDLSTFPGSLVQ